jgi:hypothetical protein
MREINDLCRFIPLVILILIFILILLLALRTRETSERRSPTRRIPRSELRVPNSHGPAPRASCLFSTGTFRHIPERCPFVRTYNPWCTRLIRCPLIFPFFAFLIPWSHYAGLRGFIRLYAGGGRFYTRINPHNKSGKVAYFSKRPQAAHHNLWCTPVIRAHIPAVTPSACRQRHQERLFVALFPGCSTSCTLFRMSFVTLDSGLWTLDHFRACAIVRLRPTTELSSNRRQLSNKLLRCKKNSESAEKEIPGR